MFKIILPLLIFCLIGWFLFTFKITDVPPGINGDESIVGYNAALIAKTGVDSNGKFLPIFTRLPESYDWKQPVTVYSTVLTFKLFGISYFNLRAASVLLVLLSGVIIFFLVKELYGGKWAILSTIIFGTIPIVTIQSHLALENIAPVPFISFWLWMMARYTKSNKTKYLIFSAIPLGISIYSYLGLRLIMPVLTFLSIGYIYYLSNLQKGKRFNLFPIILFVVSIIPFIVFLFIIRSEYPAAVFASNRPQNAMSYQQFFLPFLSSFDLSFLFIKGDLTPYHSTGKQGMFLLATLPLFLLGLFKMAKERTPFQIFVLLAFFLTPLLYGLPGSVHRASRLLTLLPMFTVITVLGFRSLFEIKRKIISIVLGLLILTLIFINYKDFVLDYWFDYPNRVNQDFEKPIHQVFEKAYKFSKQDNLNLYIQEDIPGRNPPAYLFFENAYSPSGFMRWKAEQVLPSKSIVIVSSSVYDKLSKDEMFYPEEIEVLDHGSLDLILLINRSDREVQLQKRKYI